MSQSNISLSVKYLGSAIICYLTLDDYIVNASFLHCWQENLITCHAIISVDDYMHL